MIKSIQRFFEQHISPAVEEHPAVDRERAYRVATAALLVEMSRADFDVSPAERLAIEKALGHAFELEPAEIAELLELAEAEVAHATSLFEFTRLINQHFSLPQKEKVIELLWYVALADNELDRYEEHLVRRVADLIYVPHLAFIRAKHRVRSRLGLD